MSILELTECVGIASAALSGFLFGVKKGCDWLGIFIAAFLTALGGGIMRDTLVSREIYSFTHYAPVTIVLAVSAVAIFAKLYENRDLEGKFFIYSNRCDRRRKLFDRWSDGRAKLQSQRFWRGVNRVLQWRGRRHFARRTAE